MTYHQAHQVVDALHWINFCIGFIIGLLFAIFVVLLNRR